MLTTTTYDPKYSERHRFWVAMVKSKGSDPRPYHHGDLRLAIVTAALEILSETESVDLAFVPYVFCSPLAIKGFCSSAHG